MTEKDSRLYNETMPSRLLSYPALFCLRVLDGTVRGKESGSPFSLHNIHIFWKPVSQNIHYYTGRREAMSTEIL